VKLGIFGLGYWREIARAVPGALPEARLERVWYANRGAQADDFEDTLRQLKALGCQLE